MEKQINKLRAAELQISVIILFPGTYLGKIELICFNGEKVWQVEAWEHFSYKGLSWWKGC